MMADFAAHSEYVMEKYEIDTGVVRNRSNVKVPKGMTRLSHFQITPGVLRKLRAEMVRRASHSRANPTGST